MEHRVHISFYSQNDLINSQMILFVYLSKNLFFNRWRQLSSSVLDTSKCGLIEFVYIIHSNRVLLSYTIMDVTITVTGLGDLLNFGQLFKALGNNEFSQISHILRQFCKGSKSIISLDKPFLGNFYRHLAIFFWSHWLPIEPV